MEKNQNRIERIQNRIEQNGFWKGVGTERSYIYITREYFDWKKERIVLELQLRFWLNSRIRVLVHFLVLFSGSSWLFSTHLSLSLLILVRDQWTGEKVRGEEEEMREKEEIREDEKIGIVNHKEGRKKEEKERMQFSSQF